MKEILSASADIVDSVNGFSSLALNPLSSTLFASASRDYVRQEENSTTHRGPIQLWKLDSEMMNAASAIEASGAGLKRQKVEGAGGELRPQEYI